MFGLMMLVLLSTSVYAQSGCTDPLANNFSDVSDCTYDAATAPASSSTVLSSTLNENSGLILWDGALWTHNDGGNTNDLFKLSLTDYSILSIITIPGTTNVDWEDIDQDDTYIYIGDFGNNGGVRTDLKIYRVLKSSLSGTPVVDEINFEYEDQIIPSPAPPGNTTNFDCEAMIVSDTNIYLFTKEWTSGETTLYALPKTPASAANPHSAVNQGSFDVNGLITGATYNESKQIAVLSGYTLGVLPQPFIYLFYDFNGFDFFSGNKRRLSTFLFRPQIEGITTADGVNYFISNEFSSSGTIAIQPEVQEVNLLDFLGYETSGNSTQFSDPTAWEAGVVPPSTGYAVIAHELNVDQPYTIENLKVKENANFRVNPTNELVVQNALAIDLNASMTIEDQAVLDAGSSTILNHGTLFFESNANGTAQFDQFSGSLVGSGQVTVERFIPASNRAFRYLSTPVTSSGTIRENWQQNGLNPGDANYMTNLGTHITGPGGNSNGFDATQTNNASMFTFSNSDQFYELVLNTSASGSILKNNTSYTLFVRGDRSIALTSNTSAPTPTTLRTTGDNTNFLTGGPISTDLSQTNDAFGLVANPYQAIVDFDQAETLNLRADIIVYNPALGTNGQFVTLTSNRFIQPGQSFWVQNDGDVTDPVGGASIAFEEADKNTAESSSVGVFSEEASLSLNLELYNDDEHLLDILQFKFKSGGNNGYGNEDMGKILGSSENLCSVNANTLLSVERRDLPQATDTIPLEVLSYQGTNYSLKVNAETWDANTSIVIIDHFLSTQTPLPPNEAYAFSVDATIPDSMASDRFVLGFETQTLATSEVADLQEIVIYPNPTSGPENIRLKIPQNLQGQQATLKLFDVNGKLIMTKAYSSLNPVEQMNVSSLSAGLYIITVKVEADIQSFKWSKL